MRVAAFIDGLNLYHAIVKTYSHQRFKWLDLRLLCERFLRPPDVLNDVLYFTAYCHWQQSKVDRHKEYVKAISYCGVKTIKGNFKKTTRKYVNEYMPLVRNALEPDGYDVGNLPDRLVYGTYEEKETDVNISLHLYDYAVRDEYDKAILLSADSDVCPAIEMVKRHCPDKEIISLFPPNTGNRKLRSLCDTALEISTVDLDASLLPNPIRSRKGEGPVYCPATWT